MTMPQSPSSALPALCRDDAPRPRPAAYRREAFPGCESFHLPASEVADRMHSDGLRAEHCAGGRYGSRPAMKPGVDWQDRLHGIEMFQEYPNGPVGRSWKAACNSCQSLFEPIEPCVVFFEGGSGLQADDENQPDVVLVRNPRANACNRVRNRVRQQRVSSCLRYYIRDLQGKKIILYLPFVDRIGCSGQCVPCSTKFGFTQCIEMQGVRNKVPRCRKGEIRRRFFQGLRKFLRRGSNRAPVAFEWPGKETLEPIATLPSPFQRPIDFLRLRNASSLAYVPRSEPHKAAEYFTTQITRRHTFRKQQHRFFPSINEFGISPNERHAGHGPLLQSVHGD